MRIRENTIVEHRGDFNGGAFPMWDGETTQNRTWNGLHPIYEPLCAPEPCAANRPDPRTVSGEISVAQEVPGRGESRMTPGGAMGIFVGRRGNRGHFCYEPEMFMAQCADFDRGCLT